MPHSEVCGLLVHLLTVILHVAGPVYSKLEATAVWGDGVTGAMSLLPARRALSLLGCHGPAPRAGRRAEEGHPPKKHGVLGKQHPRPRGRTNMGSNYTFWLCRVLQPCVAVGELLWLRHGGLLAACRPSSWWLFFFFFPRRGFI